MNKRISNVENCDEYVPSGAPEWAKLSFHCPLKWEELEETDNASKRFCNLCKEDVFLVENEAEFDAMRKYGTRHCVSIKVPKKSGEYRPLTGAPPLWEDVIIGPPEAP